MNKKFLIPVILTFLIPPGKVFSQEVLTLDSAIARVIRTHPNVAKAEEALEIASARIGLAESAYYPMIDASAAYTRIGPVSKFDFPGFGAIKIYPEDNYSVSVNFRQMLYDFGRTARSIELEKANKEMTENGLDISRQTLAIATISSFYTLYFLNNALEIKDNQLTNLNEHLDFVQKMKETGSATDYEILTTQVKISAIESQKADLIAMQTSQRAVLNSLLGNDYNSELNIEVKPDEMVQNVPQTDSLLTFAMENRNEMHMARQQEEIANLQYGLEKAKNNPSFSAFVTGGAKNGYIPDLYKFQPNFVAGVNFSVPIFDGYREKNNLIMAKSRINSAKLETELESRKITNEVIQAESDLMTSNTKIQQFETQVKQAQQALKLANISFKAGTITNLDLLSSETAEAESQLMLLKSKIDYQLSLAKLRMVSGEHLY
ncbi:MAG: TolC family protein [Bacteroidales bacterium]|nr:TolC family protein [Bacteroidales bacterium]